MLEPTRIYTPSNVKPKAFENLGDGNWYYNFDIKSEIVDITSREDTTPKEKTRYNYVQIRMEGKPDYKRCVERVIREYITQSQEFDLINSYNKKALGLLSDEEIEKVNTEYIEYLNKLSEIKSIIKKDFRL